VSDVIYGVSSQTIEHRVMQGRPTSATFEVFNDTAGDDDTAEFSGTATVESVSTSVDAASGASQSDPQKISLTSTTGIVVGRKYLLSEDGRKAWVTPIEVVSGDYIRVRHPLRSDYTTAATFVGTTITAAVDNTWVSDVGNVSDHIDANPGYRVRWEIVVGGATLVQYSFFDLVRGAVSYQVDLEDLCDRAPGLVDSCPTEYQIEQGRPLVEAAWKSVQARLAGMKIDTDALRNDLVTDELVTLRALNILARGGWSPPNYSLSDYVRDTQADYDRFIEQNFQVSQPHRMAVGSGGGADTVRQFVIGK
jgi:hypothetical protein